MRKFKEDDLQMAVARYLDYSKVLWCHVANERRTSIQSGDRLKKKGVKSGVPDCLIFNSKGNFIGLALELKVKPNKTTSNQKHWLLELSILGWDCQVAYDFDEAKEIIDKYMKL